MSLKSTEFIVKNQSILFFYLPQELDAEMFKRISQPAQEMITIYIEGEAVQVPQGETVAASVLIHGLGHTRTTPLSDSPRAPLCMMGVCFECLMEINGVPNIQACQVTVSENMSIRRQRGVERGS